MELRYTKLLKIYIEKTLGRKILSSTDCRYLFTDIKQKIGLTVSFNTLRRFFNLMPTKHEQSAYTLDILARYCGFTSFDHFISSVKPSNFLQSPERNNQLLYYLVMLFRNTEVKDSNDFTFNKFVRHTIIFLESNTSIIDELQCEIAKTPNGQTFYFRQFINIDRLNDYYGDGIRYYLNENKTADGQIFGNYLLCLKHWLTFNTDDLKKQYNEVPGYDIYKNKVSSTVAYAFSLRLLHAHATGIDPDAILMEARRYYITFDISKENQHVALEFYITLSQTLILTEKYEEALLYIEDLLKFLKDDFSSPSDDTILHNIHLLKAIAVYHSMNAVMAKKIFDSINPFDFFFLSKEFMTILYLTLKQRFKKSAIEQSHINDLIKKTGFNRLSGNVGNMPHSLQANSHKP